MALDGCVVRFEGAHPEGHVADTDLRMLSLDDSLALIWRHTRALLTHSMSWLTHLPFCLARILHADQLREAHGMHLASRRPQS